MSDLIRRQYVSWNSFGTGSCALIDQADATVVICCMMKVAADTWLNDPLGFGFVPEGCGTVYVLRGFSLRTSGSWQER
jgi:hypothetical protein